MKGTYIIHFDKKAPFAFSRQYGDRNHYIGYSKEVEDRVKCHLSGIGSAVTTKMHSLGINMRVGKVYDGVNCEAYLTKANLNEECDICRWGKQQEGVAGHG